MLVFVVEGKRENPEKNPCSIVRTKLNPQYGTELESNLDHKLLRGQSSRHCAIPAQPVLSLKCVDAHNIHVHSWLVEVIGNWSGLSDSLYPSKGSNPQLLLKGAQSRYFELFSASIKLPLNCRKPENNTLQR